MLKDQIFHTIGEPGCDREPHPGNKTGFFGREPHDHEIIANIPETADPG